MKTLVFITIVLHLALYTTVPAQRLLKKEQIDNIRTETALCEDEKYVWTKSNIGLLRINKLNGKTWIITQANSILPCNDITCIVICGDGQTYIATTKGMALWDNYGMLLLDTENTSLPENHIINMWLDDHENLYIKTKTFGTYEGTGYPIKPYRLKRVADRSDGAIKGDLINRSPRDYLTSNEK
jgi:ligand-binding sensor domain-containing protein